MSEKEKMREEERVAEETKKQEWMRRDSTSNPEERRLKKEMEFEKWEDVTTEVGALDETSLSDNL